MEISIDVKDDDGKTLFNGNLLKEPEKLLSDVTDLLTKKTDSCTEVETLAIKSKIENEMSENIVSVIVALWSIDIIDNLIKENRKTK